MHAVNESVMPIFSLTRETFCLIPINHTSWREWVWGSLVDKIPWFEDYSDVIFLISLSFEERFFLIAYYFAQNAVSIGDIFKELELSVET
jgi:hypothetical protein